MILLTGATGFLGSKILSMLLKNDYEVICTKRSSSDCSRVKDVYNRCKWYDVDNDELELGFAENDIQGIIHCATTYGRDEAKWLDVYDSNVIFPLELVRYAQKYEIHYFINTSSFFEKQLRLGIWCDAKRYYMDAYTKSKFVFSNIVVDNISNLKLVFIDMQIEHMFGPDDQKGKFVDFVIDKLMNNEIIDLTDGKQIKDWIYIDDVVSSFECVLNNINQFKKSSTYLFEVGTGVGTSLKDFVQIAKECTKSSSILNFGAVEVNKNEILYSVADNQSLIELGWKPEYNIKNAIKKIIGECEWIQKR